MVSVLGFTELPDYVRRLLWHTLLFVSCWTFSPSFDPLAEDLLVKSWSYILFIALASFHVCRLSHTSATPRSANSLIFVRSPLLLFFFRSVWNLLDYKLQLNPADHWPTSFFILPPKPEGQWRSSICVGPTAGHLSPVTAPMCVQRRCTSNEGRRPFVVIRRSLRIRKAK